MTELYRLVQSQIEIDYSKQATNSAEKAEALDRLLELSKPLLKYENWDLLISAPFRYPLPVHPVYQARFRPPYFNRNVFYGTCEKETAIYESSFHFLKQRRHLKQFSDTGHRTLFVSFCDLKNTNDIRSDEQIESIMDKNNYLKSHEVAQNSSSKSGILYPSCRDLDRKTCAAIYEISSFHPSVIKEWAVNYSIAGNKIHWFRHAIVDLTI